MTSCSGPACAALGSLSLDMVRYRLFVQWDPTFTQFTSTFIGQTGNNAMVYANLNTVPGAGRRVADGFCPGPPGSGPPEGRGLSRGLSRDLL